MKALLPICFSALCSASGLLTGCLAADESPAADPMGDPDAGDEAKSSIQGAWIMQSTEAYGVTPGLGGATLMQSLVQAITQSQWGLSEIVVPAINNGLGYMKWHNYNDDTDHGYYFTALDYQTYDALTYLKVSAQEQLFDADGNEVAGETGVMYLAYVYSASAGTLTMTSVLYPLGGATSARTVLTR